jgi:hypothetical protein
MSQLFLDMDGVLADFDKRAYDIFGMRPADFEHKFGSKTFWSILQGTPDFYNSFDLMLDADFLLDAVAHLQPVVLTGIPMGDWAPPQKRAWIKRKARDLPVITCRSRDKSLYCQPGDIIVDDRSEYAHLWENKMGIWVHHTSAYDSIRQLKDIGVL